MKSKIYRQKTFGYNLIRFMKGMEKSRFQSASGFALIAALLAIIILTASGLLAFTVTTQEVRITSRGLGEKKAFSAAESGINHLIENFNPDNLPGSLVSKVSVDPSTDPATQFDISAVALPTQGPEAIPLPGYSMGGGQQWGQNRYVASVSGANSRYNSSVQIDTSLGFGPIEIMTTYR